MARKGSYRVCSDEQPRLHREEESVTRKGKRAMRLRGLVEARRTERHFETRPGTSGERNGLLDDKRIRLVAAKSFRQPRIPIEPSILFTSTFGSA